MNKFKETICPDRDLRRDLKKQNAGLAPGVEIKNSDRQMPDEIYFFFWPMADCAA